jgi:hypothetical protein
MGDVESGRGPGRAQRVKTLSAALLGVALLAGVYSARHWPLVHDAPNMHYAVFLMEHGMAPYRDIVDQQMPGSYLMDALVMHTLGSGDVAWVCADVLTGLVCILGCVWIAGPKRRWAGWMGGTLGYLYHLSGGAANLGERDWFLAVILLVSMGCLFRWVRGEQPAWMAAVWFGISLASTIKPLAVLMLAVVAGCMVWQGRRKRWAASLLWGLAGGLVPAAGLCAFLSCWHAWADFIGTLRGFVLYYAGQQKAGVRHLLWAAVTPWLMALTAGAAYLYVRGRSWRTWESNLVLLGAGTGFLLYFIQGKGWPYHGYTLAVFLTLWVFLEFDAALERWQDRGSVMVATALAVLAALAVPVLLWNAARANAYSTQTITRLQADLERLGVQNEQRSVQCMDITQGCLNVLLRMRRVQATGFLYDFFLFPEHDAPVTEALQAKFLREIEATRPRVIVFTAQVWPGDDSGYYEIARWPDFAAYLQSHYVPGPEMPTGTGAGTTGYRIYLRR